MKKFWASINQAPGFTLIEMLLVLAIMSVLFAISSLLLSNLVPKASLTSQTELLISDLRQQQAKAMEGETQGNGTTQQYGIKIEARTYTLFKGSSYNSSDTDNIVVAVDSPLHLSTTFPGQQLTFTKGSGEITTFGATTNTITVSDTQSGQTKTLVLNRYGVITNIN